MKKWILILSVFAFTPSFAAEYQPADSLGGKPYGVNTHLYHFYLPGDSKKTVVGVAKVSDGWAKKVTLYSEGKVKQVTHSTLPELEQCLGKSIDDGEYRNFDLFADTSEGPKRFHLCVKFKGDMALEYKLTGFEINPLRAPLQDGPR